MAERNLWRHTSIAPVQAATLSGDLETDVAVIGGGFTGCSTALHLARKNVRVVLLEAETIGHGGSGRNVGLVNAGLWTPPDDVEKIMGKAAGQKLNDALFGGPALVFRLIEELGIDCEAVRSGSLHCGHSAAGMADLRRRCEQLQARGAPVSLLDAAETARRTGTKKYLGALLDMRAGTIQPLSYAVGLARAAVAAGAVVREHSPVIGCRHDGEIWHVRTAGGSVMARTLVQATNAYETRPEVPRDFTPVYYLQCATEPMGRELRETILPGGEGCWDTAQVMSSFRVDAAGRLIVGGVGNLEGIGAALHGGWVRRKIRDLFPDAAHLRIEHGWSGRIALTDDHMPRIVDLGPNGIGIYGYSGRGIAPGTVMGRAVSEWVVSGEAEMLPLPISRVRRERLTGCKSAFFEVGSALTHFIGSRLAGAAG